MARLNDTTISGNLSLSDPSGASEDILNVYEELTKLRQEVNSLNTEIDKKVTYGTRELLWSGTLSKGQSTTLKNANWKNYNVFHARTSDGVTMMIGSRCDSGSNASVRFVGAYDDGTYSRVFHANTTIDINTNKFTLIACSRHRYLHSSTGTGDAMELSVVELWGVM